MLYFTQESICLISSFEYDHILGYVFFKQLHHLRSALRTIVFNEFDKFPVTLLRLFPGNIASGFSLSPKNTV